MMIILIKLILNSKLDLIQTVKFVGQLFRIKIQKGGKVLLWTQVTSRMEACYSELILSLFLQVAGVVSDPAKFPNATEVLAVIADSEKGISQVAR